MITRLSFAVPFVYSRVGTSAVAERSRHLRDRIKRADTDLFRQIAAHVVTLVQDGQFEEFFRDEVTLLPVPGHAPLAPGAIANSQRIAAALLAHGLGSEISDALSRVTRVAKSAFARPDERPRAADHYRSFAMAGSLVRPSRVLLVDDFVTRGATLIGAASRVAEVFPDAEIRAFALVRSITDGDIGAIRDPCVGMIELGVDGECWRRP